LQNIINDLNSKLASSVPQDAKQNMMKENEELKKTIGSLQGQVAALNQTVDSLKNNAVLVDRLNGDNNQLNDTLNQLTGQLNDTNGKVAVLQNQAQQAEAFKNQNQKLQIIAATLKTQLENRNKEFVQLNVIKNNFVIIEAENKTLRETIRKLEE